MTEGAVPRDPGLQPERTALSWQRSGDGECTIEVAFTGRRDGPTVWWVLMRVVGDPAERVLVYDRHEWECFLDGVRKGEFDDALG